jgi:ASC-1-like (ASCH) protein
MKHFFFFETKYICFFLGKTIGMQFVICEPWFSHLQTQAKKIEICMGTMELFKSITNIEFYCNGSHFNRQIKAIRHYPNLLNCLQNESLSQLLPNILTIRDALRIYHSSWTDEIIDKHGGIIALQF